MLPHTHIKLPAWVSAANSSLPRQQKRNTVIFIILHVAVSRRQSQNIFGCLLLENLINQPYQLRWEKLGTRSLQYIFFNRSSFLLYSKFHSLPPRWSIITDKRNNNQNSKCNKNHGKLAGVSYIGAILEHQMRYQIIVCFFHVGCVWKLSCVGLQREHVYFMSVCFLCMFVFPLFPHYLHFRHGERYMNAHQTCRICLIVSSTGQKGSAR